MSYKRSSLSIALELRPAPIPLIVLGVQHALALIALWVPEAPLALSILGSGLILASARWLFWGGLVGPWRTLAWGPTRGWCLGRPAGDPCEVELLPRPFIHPQLVLLGFRTPGDRTVRLLLVPGAVGADQHRRLRAILRLRPDAGPVTPC